jgi:hypothetical protein
MNQAFTRGSNLQLREKLGDTGRSGVVALNLFLAFKNKVL